MIVKFFLVVLILPFISAECPEGSIQWPPNSPSKCYTFFLDPSTFEEADAKCQKLGQNLVSIHDQFTNTFLQQQAIPAFTNIASFWIGGSISPNKTLTWSDGSKADFTNWGGPTIISGLGVVMSISDGTWYLAFNNTIDPFVCVKNNNSD